MKKLLALLLSLNIVCGLTSTAFASEVNTFTPVIRFVVSSDTHVLGGDNTAMEARISKMLKMAYEEAEKDSSYNSLDAFLVAGDLTNDGTKEEFDRFSNAVSGGLKGNTRFLGVVAKNHDGYEMERKEMRDYYSSVTGNPADFNVVIGGYHFIGVSASEDDSSRYDSSQKKWLREQLDEATAEDPNRPVFVFHHEHVRNTVYGSSTYDRWGITHFTSILKDYPQVVDFSGHSHYPLNDPRSIWQDEFTAVGTGAIYYSEFTVEGLRAYHPDDSNDTSAFWIVELDKEHNMRLRGYDVLEGKQLCEEILKNPADSANRDFTPGKRKSASKPPVFDKNAVLKAETSFGACKLNVPAAKSADGMPVTLYRAYAETKNGGKVADCWVLPSYYRAVEQNEIEMSLTDLAAGDYTVYVVAENAYGGQSEPLKTEITVNGDNSFNNFFTRIKLKFNKIKEFFRHLFW